MGTSISREDFPNKQHSSSPPTTPTTSPQGSLISNLTSPPQLNLTTNLTPTELNLPPPPYTLHASRNNITHTSIPQWNWTNSQSRQWLFALLTDTFNMPSSLALEHANRFEGNGASIYLKDLQSWKEFLGSERGEAVAHMVFVYRGEEGAVPRAFEMI